MRFLGWSLLGLALVLALYVGPLVELGAAWPGLGAHLGRLLPPEAVAPVIARPVWLLPAALGVVFLLLGRLFARA